MSEAASRNFMEDSVRNCLGKVWLYRPTSPIKPGSMYVCWTFTGMGSRCLYRVIICGMSSSIAGGTPETKNGQIFRFFPPIRKKWAMLRLVLILSRVVKIVPLCGNCIITAISGQLKGILSVGNRLLFPGVVRNNSWKTSAYVLLYYVSKCRIWLYGLLIKNWKDRIRNR